MFRYIAALGLVASACASPLQIQNREDPNTGLTWIYKDDSLPKVM